MKDTLRALQSNPSIVDRVIELENELETEEVPIIQVSGGSLSENLIAAELYLGVATRKHPQTGIYQRGGALVRVVRLPVLTIGDGIRRAAGSLQIITAGPDIIRLNLTRAARWERFNNKSKRWVDIDAPSILARTLCDAAGEWTNTPNLTGIIEAPALRPDGTVFMQPGYDCDSGLYFDSAINFPVIAERPSRSDAVAALERLLSILSGFPFLDNASRSVAVALLITPLVRHALRTAPLIAISAPKMASGGSSALHLKGTD